MSQNESLQILISVKGTGRLAWASTSLANIEAFGWLDHLQPVGQYLMENSSTGGVYLRGRRRGGRRPGRRIVIGKGSNHHRPGPGNRREIRVSSTCSTFDLAELFHFTNSDWKWMTTPAGASRTREQWNAFYEAARF